MTSRLFFSILAFFLLTLNVNGYGQDRLSASARISLLTASPGEELYSVFGHSALRVVDPEIGLDEVYNYGTFDFDTPNFYLKFSRGQLLYKLSVTSFEYFLMEYRYEGRAVYEQVLSLTPKEKNRIYEFLLVNRLPENQYYLYDFFYDNCATRIRDIVDDHLDPDWGPDPHPEPQRSFRDMLHPYISNTPWIKFGIDLALGMPSDIKATPWDYMFLPDEMYVAFSQARHADGRPLVSGQNIVLEETLVRASPPALSPSLLLWILFFAGMFSLLKPQLSRWFDRLFFSFLGLLGLVIAFLWFLSDHAATNQNLNLLWTLPTHLFFVFKASAFNPQGITRLYFRLVFFLNLLFLMAWLFIPQDFHAAFFPIILLAMIKAFPYGFGPLTQRFPFLKRTTN